MHRDFDVTTRGAGSVGTVWAVEMPDCIEWPDWLEWIARESEAFAAVLDAGDLEARVPGCPEWALRDLTEHMGRVQRFWAAVVRVGADTKPPHPEINPPTDAPGLAAWMRASTADLLDALRTTDPATPAWVWWRDDRTVGAIARHQVQEAAVHRWDAQSAVGEPQPLERPVGADGVDEFVWIARQLRPVVPVTLTLTDAGRSIAVSDDPSVATVSATASDLVLLLHGRIAAAAVRVEGDRGALEPFLSPID
jgi:uncharacterized protein (TIGR03083 family)